MVRSGHKRLAEGGRLRTVFLLPILSQNKDERKFISAVIATTIFTAKASHTQNIILTIPSHC